MFRLLPITDYKKMREDKIKKTTTFLLLLNVVIVISYGAVFFFERSARAKVETKSNAFAEQAGGIEDYKNIKRVLDDTEKDRLVIEEYFVNKDSSVLFIKKLEEIGAITKTPVSIVSADIENKKFLKVDLNISGSFADVYKALSLMEAMPYKVSFKKVYFKKNSIDGSDQQKKLSAGGWTAEVRIELRSFLTDVE